MGVTVSDAKLARILEEVADYTNTKHGSKTDKGGWGWPKPSSRLETDTN